MGLEKNLSLSTNQPTIMKSTYRHAAILFCLFLMPMVGFPQSLTSQPGTFQDEFGRHVTSSTYDYLQDEIGQLPSPDTWTVVTQSVSGIFYGSVVGLAGGFISNQLINCGNNADNIIGAASEISCIQASIALGATIGYIMGSSYSVYNTGNGVYQQGSFLATFAFDVLGMGTAIALLNIRDGSPQTTFGKAATVGAPILLPVAGALAGYYLFRRPADDYISGSLINLSEEQTSLSMPKITAIPAIPLANNKMVPTVSLLSVQL